jgi:hypothetical protein
MTAAYKGFDKFMRRHKERLVAMANANIAKITTEFSSVKCICDAADLVWGVWQDPEEENGIGVMVVKGAPILEFIENSGVAEELIEDAIPCICAEQAEALRLVLDHRS